MEFICNCHTASRIEGVLEGLIKSGYARKVHDSKVKDGKRDESGLSTVKYNIGFDEREAEYELNVKTAVDVSNLKFTNISKVPIRFWYDWRRSKANDGAGIKITDEGLVLILKSMTVVGKLQEAGFKISDNGVIDLDQLIVLMDGLLTRINKEKVIEKSGRV